LRSEGTGRGHDRAGSPDPMAQRDGAFGDVHDGGRCGGQEGRWCVWEARHESRRYLQEGQAESPRVSTLRQDQREEEQADCPDVDARAIDTERAWPSDRSWHIDERASARPWQARQAEALAAFRDGEGALTANPLLAPNWMGCEEQDHQPPHSRALLDRAGQDWK